MPNRNYLTPWSTMALLAFLLFLTCAPARARHADGGLPLAFASYPELAAAVRQRLADQAAPTPPVAALAREITAGLTDPRARALTLSDWVRTRIRHTDASLYLEGEKPRPAAAVLAARTGTGEEMVVLLQALLAASGIDSSAALVNRGSDYALPLAPMPAAFDHLLVYLPALKLYLDPATDTIAAGYLPPSLLGKPVLLVAGGGFAMTPMMQPQSVRATATIDIRRDGSGTVKLDRTYAGALAEPARKAAGQSGAGGDEFRVSQSAASAHVLALPGARALATTYPSLSTVANAMADMPWDSVRSRDVACPAIDAADETRYQLPNKVRILALPASVNVVHNGVFYRADYERQGNAVLVKRRLTFRNGRPTCSPAEVRALQPALERIARDLRSRITIAAR
jgi:hypothetical protein